MIRSPTFITELMRQALPKATGDPTMFVPSLDFRVMFFFFEEIIEDIIPRCLSPFLEFRVMFFFFKTLSHDACPVSRLQGNDF